MVSFITFDQLNDSQKQAIASAMINVHQTRLQNSVVEYILEKAHVDSEAPFSYDDITNYTPTGQVSIRGSWVELDNDEREEKLEHYGYLAEKAQNIYNAMEEQGQSPEIDDNALEIIERKLERWQKVVNYYDDIRHKLEDLDCDEYPEIYQWFSCSDWLIHKLDEYGQCTLDGEYWGRQCCGQSITLDYVIQKIAFDWFAEYGKNYIKEGTKGWDIIQQNKV
jgi:hypothetical protein